MLQNEFYGFLGKKRSFSKLLAGRVLYVQSVSENRTVLKNYSANPYLHERPVKTAYLGYTRLSFSFMDQHLEFFCSS
jgi:hypothetical protein